MAKNLPQAPTVPIAHDSRGEGAGGGTADATARLKDETQPQAANQNVMRTSREAKGSGVFSGADSDPALTHGRQLSPGEFESFHGLKVPPRPEIPVTPIKPSVVNRIVEGS